MADGLNKVMLIGNLGVDGELRQTSGGQALLKLRLACSETYLDKNKVRQEKTEWVSVTVWGKRGEALAKFLTKGSRIFVEGRLQTSSYEAKDGGGKRYRTEVVASNIILAGGRPGGASGGAPSSGGPPEDDDGTGERTGFADAPHGDGSDDIPFITSSYGAGERWW